MKKIVFISNLLGGGGAERVMTLLANEFRKKGFSVTILCLKHSTDPYRTEVPVVELGLSSGRQQIAALRRKFRQLKPDAVIAFEYHVAIKTVLAAAGLKCRVIVSERTDPHRLDDQPLKKRLRNFLYGCADVLVCQTNDARAYFSGRIQKKSVVILNPISEALPQWDAMNHNKVIVNFCRLEKPKNIPMLLDAFRLVHENHPEYSLAIYGEGAEEQNVRSRIREMGLEDSVALAPFAKNIHEIASRCAMFVSSSDHEGLSNSMLEAMAMGMPVVCTDCPIGGARMVIQNRENGLLVPTNDAKSMANAIQELLREPEFADRLGAEAKKIGERLSLNQISAKWESLLQVRAKESSGGGIGNGEN